MRIRKCIAVSLSICFLAMQTHAGAPIEQLDPSRIQPETLGPTLPRSKPIRIQVPIQDEKSIPVAKTLQFTLKSIQFQGARHLMLHQLKPIYSPYIGKNISIDVLQQIVKKITAHLRNSGFVLTQAILPPQEIKNHVLIRIVEGYIDNVYIEGPTSVEENRLIKTYGRRIAASHPLHIDALERYALLANDIPGLKVRALISPSKSKVGAADITFVVEKHKIDGAISYDNRGTNVLGPHRLTFNGHYYSLGTAGDTYFRVLGTVPGWDDIQYYELGHAQNLGTTEWRFDLNTSHTVTRPKTFLLGGSPLPIRGDSTRVMFQATYPIIRSRKQNLTFQAGLRLLNSVTRLRPSDVRLFDDNLRVFSIGGTYDFADDHGVNLISLILYQGLDIFSARAVPATRPGGQIDFTRIDAQVTRVHALPANFSLMLAGRGQVAFSELLSSEEIGIGGTQFGSAYDPSEITGDHGLAGKIELRYDVFTSPSHIVQGQQYYVFYDGGVVWNINRGQNGGKRQSLSSVGAGIRFAFKNYLNASLEVAKPLTKILQNEGNRYTRVFFVITGRL